MKRVIDLLMNGDNRGTLSPSGHHQDDHVSYVALLVPAATIKMATFRMSLCSSTGFSCFAILLVTTVVGCRDALCLGIVLLDELFSPRVIKFGFRQLVTYPVQPKRL